MKTLSEIKEFIIKNRSYGTGDIVSDDVKINKGKVDKHIEFVLSKVKDDEDVKFAVLTNGINSGSRQVCAGDSILLITSERIIYGRKGATAGFTTAIKTINISECRDVEAMTFGIIQGRIKINTVTELIDFKVAKKEAIRLADMIEKVIESTVETKKAEPLTAIAELSSADELKKFKELLDLGVITQAEFDAKKKQLLGL